MKVLESTGKRIGRKRLLVVGLACLLALSGCSGLGGGDGTATATATPTVTDNGTNGGIESVDVTAAEVVGPATDAMAAVESYQLSGKLNVTAKSSNAERTSQVTVDTVVDRATPKLHATQSVQGIETDSYIVDGVLYQRSQQFVQAYDSEWIKIDVSNQTTDRFNRNDELAGHRVMLKNASVTVRGAETIDGQRAYVLDLDVNETALDQFYGFNGTGVETTNVTTTVWIAADSKRLLRASGSITQQTTLQGQSVETTVDYTETFRYSDVSITLPDAARSAVEINGTTGAAV